MKALATSALLIALLSIPHDSSAQYLGTFVGDEPYTINIDNGAAPGKTVATISYLAGGKPATADQQAQLGKKTKFDILSVPSGARSAFVQDIPRGTRLIRIEVTLSRGSSVNLEIVQGLNSFPDTCEVDQCTYILEIE